MSEQLRKAAQEFLWTAEQYRSAHYNGTHMTADGTAAWAIREREFKAKAAALREALLAAAPDVENERRRLYEAVRGLPWLDVVTDEDGTGGRMVAQSAVLALLAPPAEKEQT